MTAMVIFSCEPRILVHTRFGAPVLPPDGASFLSSIRQAAASHEQATSNFFVMPAGYDKILATCQGEYLFFSFSLITPCRKGNSCHLLIRSFSAKTATSTEETNG
jgi:hypothetical protein